MGINKITKFFKFLLVILGIQSLYGCGDPAIDVSCAINNYGSGRCTFTNTGDGSGKVCGKVVILNVYNDKKVYSDKFCSGNVEPSSSTQINVSVKGFRDLCEHYKCEYSWEE